MRIAYLLPAPGVPVQGPSGASAHVRGIVGALRRAHDVRLYAANITDRRGRFGEPTPAVATGVPGWPSWAPRYREMREVRASRRVADRVLRDAAEGWVPDLVIERHALFSDAGWRVHDRLGVPWVLEVNAPPVIERTRFEEVLRPEWAEEWQRRVLLAAPQVVAVSVWLTRWLEGEIGCRDVNWVPNGVTGLRGDRARGRARLGVPQDVPVIGFVGSMKPWHGWERLGRVARVTGARLVLVGPIADPPDWAICTGHLEQAELADVVAAMDVGLAPYPQDAPPWFCPLKILDYRAQGTPVVASDVGDCGVLVEAGGVVVPPGDEDALVDAVRYWMGRRVSPRVRSWRTVGREMLRVAGVPGGPEMGLAGR